MSDVPDRRRILDEMLSEDGALSDDQLGNDQRQRYASRISVWTRVMRLISWQLRGKSARDRSESQA